MDFDTQQQILADQLRRYQGQAQTQAPQGRMVGRTYVAPNPLEYLAAGLKGYGGMKGEQQTQQEIGELAKRRQEQLAQALDRFSQRARGTEATPYQPGTPDVPGAQEGMPATMAQPAMPGDMGGAYSELLRTGLPELQRIGVQGVAATAQSQQEMAARQAEAQRRAQEAEEQKERERARIMAIMNDPNLTPQQKMVMGIPEKALDPNFGRTKLNFVDGMPVDPYTGAPAGAAIPQRPRVPDPANDLVLPDPANPGRMIPNQPLMGARTQLAISGRAPAAPRAAAPSDEGGTSQAALNKLFGKPAAGYRWTPDGQRQEAIPGGPADQKALAQEAGKGTVDSVVAGLRSSYDKLDKGGGITSVSEGSLSNLGRRLSQSGAGQFVGGAVGSQNQKERDAIAQARPLLLQAIMKATGMSAKQMDSNAELKLYLATATDPTLSLQANREALDRIEQLYGSGAGNAPIAPNPQTGGASKSAPKRIRLDAQGNIIP